MSVAKSLATADDLLRMPRGNGKRYELVDGEIVEMAAAGLIHGIIVGRVATQVGGFVQAHQFGDVAIAETGFFLAHDPDRVRAPDVAFIAASRFAIGSLPAGFGEIIPDFVVEVISPTDSASDFQGRIDEWLDAGVKLVWAVFPSRKSIFIWRGRKQVERRSAGDELVAEPVLPSFRWTVDDLFRGFS